MDVPSQRTLELIDAEIHRIVDEQLVRAYEILEREREKVETVAAALLDRETLDATEFNLIMDGQALPELELEIDHSTDDEPVASVETEETKPADTVEPEDSDSDNAEADNAKPDDPDAVQ